MNTIDLIRNNFRTVTEQIRQAELDADRATDTVRLVGVTKYVDAPTTQCLVDVGCLDLGENRPQVLWQKAETLVVPQDFRWHMIGHVQTNKLRRLLKHQPLIHSVDSERLLLAIDEESERQDLVTDVLLEVNISGDDNKTGLSPEETKRLASLKAWSSIRVCGLMAMAGWGTEGEEATKQFTAVAELRDNLENELGAPLPELSMGMSGDYREAIAAGATMVRIGSALFEGVL
ncbi:YggS family pyridoxal phosphate-dependent enzyme [Stieleria sp. JC731]|uniref:YggS family pyridoxal phosphate-dependent enzyme n=1 Tax=Pirellulaceae TaxID=2691357 RepID=UPI001E609FE4|nr:YggS family pyridoxal phosphate-dependent enzyme [Stieleria sp. JC731]MCC9600038.1 YggS family pyridoxal phosphate-dependent enzyme [Stieleria sp. JC731]